MGAWDSSLAKALVAPTAVGATIGAIWVLLGSDENWALKLLEGTVTGVAYGVIQYYFGPSVAIPVLVFSLIGRAVVLDEKELVPKIRKYVGCTLIGALIGYGIYCIPPDLTDQMRIHVHLNR